MSAAPAHDSVLLHFRPTASAPQLKKTKFKVKGHYTLFQVETVLRKQLKLSDRDKLFLYVNSSFAPQTDMDMGTLYKSFGIQDELTINYALMEAWG